MTTKKPVPTSAEIIRAQQRAEREEVVLLFKAKLLETMEAGWTFENQGVAWMMTLQDTARIHKIVDDILALGDTADDGKAPHADDCDDPECDGNSCYESAGPCKPLPEPDDGHDSEDALLLNMLLDHITAVPLKEKSEWTNLEQFLNDSAYGLFPTLQNFVDNGGEFNGALTVFTSCVA